MEMFGVAIVLLGLLALILSSIILIISIIKNQKSKLISGLILITSIILMSLGAVIMSMSNPDDKQQTTKEGPSIEAEDPPEDANDSTEEEMPVTNDEVEASNNDAEREYYLSEIAPYVDKVTKEFDGIWNKHWKEPFDRAGRGEADENEVKRNLDTLIEKYSVLRDDLESFKPKELSSENEERFEFYKTRMEAALTSRIFVSGNISNAIESDELTENVIDNSMAIIEISDEDILEAAMSITEIKSNLSLLEE